MTHIFNMNSAVIENPGYWHKIIFVTVICLLEQGLQDLLGNILEGLLDHLNELSMWTSGGEVMYLDETDRMICELRNASQICIL